MPTNRFTKTLFSLGLAASLSGSIAVHAADPASPTAKSGETSPAQTAAPAKKEWLLPNGGHWSNGTETEKRAYVLGILNMAMVEYQLTGPNPKHRTTVPKLVKALDGMAVPQIVETVDAYYKANPDKQQQPIIEVIWFQMVAPKAGPAKAK
ncbi:MAG: hypothetical protein RKR03_04810 [Candidatus Competibacter sp.]|nr:hypothetical protein [Candidatus Competibacter sp.]